ncbi:MAG: hypothetical protein ACTHOG_09470 [Marmoricola sp.]
MDPAPGLGGTELASIIPGTASGARVASAIADAGNADIAFVATTSFIHQVEPIINTLLDRGMNVVSICEELGFGFFDHEPVARRLDERARGAGLTVLGTGCNPGILLDTLPLLLSSLTLDVTRVTMRRTAEMSGYGAILSKFGFGLTPGQFAAERDAGHVIGHVGFRESVAALADGLGWNLDAIVVDDPQPVLLTERARRARHATLEPGTIAVIRHAARGVIDRKVVIQAAIDFGIFEPGDPFREGGSWRLESSAQTFEFTASQIDSYASTVAVAANVIPRVLDARPGLLTMADIPVKKFARRQHHGDAGHRQEPSISSASAVATR